MSQHTPPKPRSLWEQTVDIPRRAPLSGDVVTQAIVIGAGMAGVLIADRLTQRGVATVVLEASRIGSGQTRRTTAKITSQHGMTYDALIKRFGQERAQQYAQANEQAIRAYAECVRKRDIDCDFRETASYLYAFENDAPLRREAEAAAALGIDARFVSDPGLPFAVAGAVRFGHQACFHPLRFLRAMSEGLEIYEDTCVLAVEGNNVRTTRGTVRAEHIVFASHYPFINVPGWYFLRMHQERSYVLALESDWLPDALYFSPDQDGLSLRAADGLLLVSGGSHRTGENSQGRRYEALHAQARKLLPVGREVYRWSAQDCMTLDGMPYIGRFSQSTPNWYVATGFGKWGMSSSMAAALCIAGLITDDPPEWWAVFSPARLRLSASAKSLATDTAQAFKGLSREWLGVPDETLDALPNGHGGIVEADGHKAGVYKDETGRCHIVDPRCPHLGCQLEWNPDEKSWDCPCHGSRFAYDGSLLDDPAQESLAPCGDKAP